MTDAVERRIEGTRVAGPRAIDLGRAWAAALLALCVSCLLFASGCDSSGGDAAAPAPGPDAAAGGDAPAAAEMDLVAAIPDDLVAVPAGEFQAGCNEAIDSECLPPERPGAVRSTEAFAIDRTEVTVAAYRACVEAGRCSEPSTDLGCNWILPGREAHPINCVDWDQAATYCDARGQRLPTEWEWEKAARGVDGRKHPWGNEKADCRRAVIDEGTGNACGQGDTTFAVGSKPDGASPYGALDMIGNVWEWTATRADNSGAPIVRGGGFYVEAPHARVSVRIPFGRGGRAPFTGFRCAR